MACNIELNPLWNKWSQFVICKWLIMSEASCENKQTVYGISNTVCQVCLQWWYCSFHLSHWYILKFLMLQIYLPCHTPFFLNGWSQFSRVKNCKYDSHFPSWVSGLNQTGYQPVMECNKTKHRMAITISFMVGLTWSHSSGKLICRIYVLYHSTYYDITAIPW